LSADELKAPHAIRGKSFVTTEQNLMTDEWRRIWRPNPNN